jgi:hypothetical protein
VKVRTAESTSYVEVLQERCDRRSDPGRRERCLGTNVRRIVGIENLHLRGMSKHERSNKTMTNRKLILMGMAPEDI